MLREVIEEVVCGLGRDYIFRKYGECMGLGEWMGKRNVFIKVLLNWFLREVLLLLVWVELIVENYSGWFLVMIMFFYGFVFKWWKGRKLVENFRFVI